MVTTADTALMLQRQGDRLFEGGKEALTEIELTVSRSDFRGTALVVPRQIQTDSQASVPVVLLSQQTVLHAWEVPEQYNLMVAVSDLDSGIVRVTRALVDRKEEERGGGDVAVRPPKPSEAMANAVVTKAHRLDLRATQSQTGTLAIAAISFDVVSNTSTVELVGSKPRATGVAHVISPRPNPAQGLPTYAPTARSPQAPRSGLAFSIETAGASGANTIVNGAFAKVLAVHEDLPTPQQVRDNGVEHQATAVVPLTVMILGLGWKAPRLYSLAVPVYDSVNVTPGQVVRGQFASQIPLAEAALPQGQYVAYVFMDGVAYGPQRFQLQ